MLHLELDELENVVMLGVVFGAVCILWRRC